MRIEFDPTNRDEATAVRAMLTALQTPASGGYVTSTETRLVGEVPSERNVRNPQELGRAIRPDVPTATPLIVDYASEGTDSTGTPWDARIHATPASLTKSTGTWRAKRGVKAEEVAAVRAELKADALGAYGHIKEAEQLLSGEPQTKTLDVPPAIQEIVAEVMSEAPKAPLPEPAASAPATPPAPPASEPSNTPTPAPTSPAPTAPVGTSGPSFLDVMKAITAAQKDGKIDTAKVKELCAAVGAGESTMGLNGPDNGDKRVAFMAALEETING